MDTTIRSVEKLKERATTEFRNTILERAKLLKVEEFLSTKEFKYLDKAWIIQMLKSEYGKTRKFETTFLSTGTFYLFRVA